MKGEENLETSTSTNVQYYGGAIRSFLAADTVKLLYDVNQNILMYAHHVYAYA